MSDITTTFCGERIEVVPVFSHADCTDCSHVTSLHVRYDDDGDAEQQLTGLPARVFWYMWRQNMKFT